MQFFCHIFQMNVCFHQLDYRNISLTEALFWADAIKNELIFYQSAQQLVAASHLTLKMSHGVYEKHVKHVLGHVLRSMTNQLPRLTSTHLPAPAVPPMFPCFPGPSFCPENDSFPLK